jgi:hypothetical protein
MTEPEVKRRTPRLSVAGLIESVQIREAAEALAAHRTRVVHALGAALVARLFQEVMSSRQWTGEDHAGIVTSFSLMIVIYATVLWLMALRGRDRFAFGIALGIAVIEATSQLVGAFQPGMDGWSKLGPAALVVVTHGFLAYSAFQASRDFPSQSSSRPWVLGFLVAALVVVGVPSLRNRVVHSATRPELVLTRPTEPSAPLRAALQMVTQCARDFAAGNPSTGYPRSMRAMGPAGTGCIADERILDGEGPGWMLTYVPGERDATGRTPAFTVLGRQSAGGGAGVGFFASDHTGRIRASRPVGR